MLISISSKAEKSKASQYEARNGLEDKKTKIESLEVFITSIMCDRYTLRMDNKLLVKQRNIYRNIVKRLY